MGLCILPHTKKKTDKTQNPNPTSVSLAAGHFGPDISRLRPRLPLCVWLAVRDEQPSVCVWRGARPLVDSLLLEIKYRLLFSPSFIVEGGGEITEMSEMSSKKIISQLLVRVQHR